MERGSDLLYIAKVRKRKSTLQKITQNTKICSDYLLLKHICLYDLKGINSGKYYGAEI